MKTSIFIALAAAAVYVAGLSSGYYARLIHVPEHPTPVVRKAAPAACCGPCCKCETPCQCGVKPCCQPRDGKPLPAGPKEQPKEIRPLDGPDSIELGSDVTLVFPDGATITGTDTKIAPASPTTGTAPLSMQEIERRIKALRDEGLRAKPLPKE